MKKYRILLVEDSEEIAAYNRTELEKSGYSVETAGCLDEARKKLELFKPDLLVLDIMLPDGSGVDLCREIREAASSLPILFLSGLGESEQIVKGLRAGGDDYMVKPYRVEELQARIEASLRRLEMMAGSRMTAEGCCLFLDAKTQRAYINEWDLMLKPKEYRLLEFLMRNRNRYTGAAELYGEIWGMESNEDVRTVFVHISNIRSKMRQTYNCCPIVIEGFKNKGYRLVVSNEGDD
ncbi:two-component system catabolic regulation response regulator CreB [Hungatella effluvii]|uniref:Stage 0 sporulation protein A homolog n=1 Tax=Hungatella effluvii TaxID=1096246 RepID=A0A2V3YM09_9FIRM|nr:response regulator transcription factor [Hungatella effluvii]PXX54973.1 two-component system catabolic regulation response regulator CreB [Hungatella effluvii]